MSLRTPLFLAPLFVACASAPPPAPPASPPPLPLAVAAPPAPPAPASPAEDDLPVPILPTDPVWGSRHAYVTVVEFAELQCPFCARVAPTIQALRARYGPDTLRIVWKHEPLAFHQNARSAAEASQGVFALGGNDAFWAFTDAAFADQKGLGEAKYEDWALAAGVDPDRLHKGLDAHEWAAQVDAGGVLAKAVGANGTPAFFVNGVSLSGAQPLQKFVDLIDAELAKAKAREAAGTDRDRLYAVLSRESFANRPPSAKEEEEEKKDEAIVYKIPLGRSPARGPKTALVTILEFGDFQCPFTRRVEPTLERIRTTYGDDVRIVWVNNPLPFHPRAEPAAELALEARAQRGDVAFWKVHDALLGANADLESAGLELAATAAGLDVKRAMAAVAAKKHAPEIEQDGERGEDFLATGTPHFFINGRRLVGAQPFEKFQAMIDEEVARAKALVASGTKRAAVYEALVRDGKGAAEPETRAVAVPASAPARGGAAAPVVIQEFGDLECPFCKRAEDTLAQIGAEYGGKVRLVWRDLPLPFHTHAQLEAEAAREALAQKGVAGFWEMHDRLLARTGTSEPGTRDVLDREAQAMGLDMTAWAAALDGHTHAAEIAADKTAADAAKISGTPSFVVGGYYVSGAQPVARFRRVIERVRREGPAKGTPATPPSARAAPWAARPAASAAPAATSTPSAPAASAPAPAPTRLEVHDLVIGAGAEAKPGSRVSVHYVGELIDGTVFDESRPRGAPFQFTLGAGEVIAGFDKGIPGMRVGGKRRLVIPPELGYGERGAPPKIPASAMLVFEVELVDVR